ncbi:MAG: peptidylprolyl isomerase [Prevotella sp.]|nr:peptidylprolyl isomerase [Prevotella sp.]
MRRIAWSILMAVILPMTVCAQTKADSIDNVTKGNVRVKIHTSMGDIVVRLYDATPIHRDNFIKLVKDGFYDGTLFHRVIKDFMIQGGDPDSKGASADQRIGSGGPDYTLQAEIVDGLYHKRGALAAAREGDAKNPERRSSGSQFYIVWGRTFSPRQIEYLSDKMLDRGGMSDVQRTVYATVGGSPHLDGLYTVFGEVETGLDVVDRIQRTPTTPSNRPLENVEMSMSLIE